MTRVLVCGPRDWPHYWDVFEVLDGEHKANPITCIIEGGALGIDRFSRTWATFNKVPNDPCPVDNALDGQWPNAGPRRNGRMLREKKPERCIAFVATPPTKGTTDMIRQAKKAGIPVREVVL